MRFWEENLLPIRFQKKKKRREPVQRVNNDVSKQNWKVEMQVSIRFGLVTS